MKYYLIGIKGSGVSTLANLLYDLGNEVSGYDDCLDYKFTMKGLEERKIQIFNKDNLPDLDKDTIVSASAAMPLDHHELKRINDLGIKFVPYHELLGDLTKKLNSICVCGTHGKTTTSFMISNMLLASGGCNYFVGDGSGHGDKNSDIFVIESCEFNKHFLSYYPKDVVLTNIELDHTETYPTIESMIETFQEFVNKCDDTVVCCGDDKNIQKLNIKKAIYFGFDENNDVVIKNKKSDSSKTTFDIYYNSELFDSYEIPLFGNHIVLDAAAAIAIGIKYNVSKDIIKNTLKSLTPAKRRFNEIKVKDSILIDDYAHHPTEIRVTYESAKEKYKDKKIIAVFLPNTYSRTEALFDDFVKSLSLFDKAYVMPIKCDRELQEDYPNINSGMLVEKIPNSVLLTNKDISKLINHKDDIICFMSCANIGPVIEEYKKLL